MGLSGCGAKLNLEVLAPAQVTVPAHIQTIAYVDRSRPKNVGQGILGALEGAVSGEAIGADKAGRKTAAEGLVTLLQESPRFDVVVSEIDKKELGSSLFDKAMGPELVEKICGTLVCQGVVSLEALDSDSSTHFSTQAGSKTVDGKSVATTEWTANRTTHVLTAWRLYDVTTGAVIDNLRDYNTVRTWTGTGKTRGAAKRDLPGQVRTVKAVALDAGSNYGRRIAPHYVWVTRAWFGGGSDEMKAAKRKVKMDDWAGASEIWAGVAETADDPKLQGKAHFNMALAAEVGGDLDAALAALKAAADKMKNRKIGVYMRAIQQRRTNRQTLWEQMQGAETGPVEVPSGDEVPLAIPNDTPAPTPLEE